MIDLFGSLDGAVHILFVVFISNKSAVTFRTTGNNSILLRSPILSVSILLRLIAWLKEKNLVALVAGYTWKIADRMGVAWSRYAAFLFSDLSRHYYFHRAKALFDAIYLWIRTKSTSFLELR